MSPAVISAVTLATAAVCGLFACSAGAQNTVPAGTAGLTRLEFRIRNTGDQPLACEARLAHWYSDRLAEVAPGAEDRFELWADSGSGTVYRISVNGDRMPVERFWCGLAGASWNTRYEMVLPRHPAGGTEILALQCQAAGAQSVTCAP